MNALTLGRSGLTVSPIAYGTWQLSGDWGAFDEEEAIAAIRFARERRINCFDTPRRRSEAPKPYAWAPRISWQPVIPVPPRGMYTS